MDTMGIDPGPAACEADVITLRHVARSLDLETLLE